MRDIFSPKMYSWMPIDMHPAFQVFLILSDVGYCDIGNQATQDSIAMLCMGGEL